MINTSPATSIQYVSSFDELVSTPFSGNTNAICWSRTLTGNFAEIVNKLTMHENIEVVQQEQLQGLALSEQGQLARTTLINDMNLLQAHGAAPTLNLIRCYERDDAGVFFPTDVYSFHADRSDIPADTFLCTYHGAASEIIPNTQARQKIRIPEILDALQKQYNGPAEGFEDFLTDHFFDLHYEANADAQLVNLGLGNIWRLAIDHPESKVAPCIHRAPLEKNGEIRLLLIC